MPQPHAKLTDDEQYQVCRWYGEFKSPTQIKGLLKTHFGKDLTLKNVWAYANGNLMKKWKPLIESLRQEWALGVMDIPLAHKRARLEKLVILLTRAERNTDVTEFQKIKQCLEVLHEMREEMEAGKAEFTNVYMTTIHQYSDAEIIRQRDAVLTRLKLLGGRNGLRYGAKEGTGTITLEAEADAGGGSNGGGRTSIDPAASEAGDARSAGGRESKGTLAAPEASDEGQEVSALPLLVTHA